MSERYHFETDILPIEIRDGKYVHIQGIPYDMTQKEAEKIIAVVLALASPESSKEG